MSVAGLAPCVVMGHGFGATRDAGLAPFAERFAAAGLPVLTFDYRGFGTSEGTLRQDVNHRHQRQDYHAAIAAARSLADIDPDRVALWGSSYSGGHVIAVAAEDSRVRAVVSQGASMDGRAALFGGGQRSGPGKGKGRGWGLAKAGLRDLVRAATHRSPYLVPITGPVGSDAVIAGPGGLDGYQAIMGPTFRNEMCARGVLRIAFKRPVTFAGRVTCPVLIVAAENDSFGPRLRCRTRRGGWGTWPRSCPSPVTTSTSRRRRVREVLGGAGRVPDPSSRCFLARRLTPRRRLDVDGRDAVARPGDHRDARFVERVRLAVHGERRHVHEVARVCVDEPSNPSNSRRSTPRTM